MSQLSFDSLFSLPEMPETVAVKPVIVTTAPPANEVLSSRPVRDSSVSMLDNHRKEFVKLFRETARYHHRYQVFRDFVTMAAVALENAFLQCDELENEYFQTIPSAQLIKLTKGELVAHQDPLVRAVKLVAEHIDVENWDYSEEMSRMETGLEDHEDTERQWEQQMKDAAKDVTAGLQQQAKEEQQNITLPDMGKNTAEDALQQRIGQVIGSEKETAIQIPKGIEPPSSGENPRLHHDISSAKENLRSTQETERAQARDISTRELAIERGEYAKPSGRTHHIQKER